MTDHLFPQRRRSRLCGLVTGLLCISLSLFVIALYRL